MLLCLFFFTCSGDPRHLHFPYTTLFRSSGTVTSAPVGINCGVTCAASFASGTAVTLTATPAAGSAFSGRSEEHTSELQSRGHLVCRLLLEKKKSNQT